MESFYQEKQQMCLSFLSNEGGSSNSRTVYLPKYKPLFSLFSFRSSLNNINQKAQKLMVKSMNFVKWKRSKVQNHIEAYEEDIVKSFYKD
jgi:hypothetical protein